MKIKTCEEYVLRRVDDLENKVEDLIERNIELEVEKNEILGKYNRLLELIKGVATFKYSDYSRWCSIDVWETTNKEEYDYIYSLINEREPNSEE